MFVNLSNHNSSKWSDNQIKAAQQYGKIVDLQFPNIDPEATKEQIENLALDYIGQIKEMMVKEKETAATTIIHVMGEMNFTFQVVVNAEIELGVDCVASTTKRISEELPDGQKITKFEFVQFRRY